MTILNRINAIIASTLDSLAMGATRFLPIDGAGVVYQQGTSWHMDAWKEGSSWVLQVGGYEAAIDLKT